MSFTDVHEELQRFIPSVALDHGAYTLDRMSKLMEHLGNPQNSYKVIHIAGTSGKTSTAYYLANFLCQTGKKIGLTVSPYVDEINERVQVDLKPLNESKFTKELAVFLRLVDESKLKPTYFEVLVAFAFWEFKRQKVDYAVVEVGVGGLLDPTNVIARKNKVCVITDIGLDHTEILGKDLTSIASQKAGIVKPYNLVISYEQGDEVMDVLREVCDQQQAELHEIWPLKAGELPSNLPLFQRRNWYLAYSAYKILAERDELPELDESQLSQTAQTYVPARMERVVYKGKTVVMDGAHNSQKLQSLVKSMKQQYPGQKLPVLVSFVATKQTRIRHCLEELLPLTSHLIITTFSTDHSEKVSVNPLKIAEQCEVLGFEDWTIINDPDQAFKKLVATKAPVVLVAGSFYLLGHIRPLVLPKK